MKLKIVFMGTPDFSVPILEALIENYDVISVVTQPDRISGKKILEPAIKKVALKHNIKVFQPVKIRKEYEEITLNKGVCVARLHYSFIEANDRVMDAAHEVRNNAIYNNEDLLVCVNKEENLDKYIVETIVDGEKTYLKISQKEGQNE